MSKQFLMLGGGVVLSVLAALLVVAWIEGGAQPMQWTEQPVTVHLSAALPATGAGQ